MSSKKPRKPSLHHQKYQNKDNTGQASDKKKQPSIEKAKRMTLRRPNKQLIQRSEELHKLRIDKNYLEPQRLQKVLASSGVASRRHAEEMIEAGLVCVNGQVAILGAKILPTDEVTVRGKKIITKWQDRLPRILLYYKQEGEIVSRHDPKGRVSIFDRLPSRFNYSSWISIGRLDVNTSGLLILTTSGELSNRFAHPRFAIDREYAVRVSGSLTDEQMRTLVEKGVELEDGLAKAVQIRESQNDNQGKNNWYTIVMQEGRNREVRRIFEYFGLTVNKLVRLRFGPIGIPPRLKRGQFYELNEVEVAYVLKEMKMDLSKQLHHQKRIHKK